MSELKPFHESIVAAIGRTKTREQACVLGRLISETKIPKNHEAILVAWMNKGIELGLTSEDFLEEVGLTVSQQGAAALIDGSSEGGSQEI